MGNFVAHAETIRWGKPHPKIIEDMANPSVFLLMDSDPVGGVDHTLYAAIGLLDVANLD